MLRKVGDPRRQTIKATGESVIQRTLVVSDQSSRSVKHLHLLYLLYLLLLFVVVVVYCLFPPMYILFGLGDGDGDSRLKLCCGAISPLTMDVM